MKMTARQRIHLLEHIEETGNIRDLKNHVDDRIKTHKKPPKVCGIKDAKAGMFLDDWHERKLFLSAVGYATLPMLKDHTKRDIERMYATVIGEGYELIYLGNIRRSTH